MKLSNTIRLIPLALSLLACETPLPAASRPAEDLCAKERQLFEQCLNGLFDRTNCPGSEALIEGAILDSGIVGDAGIGVDSGEVDFGILNCMSVEKRFEICSEQVPTLFECLRNPVGDAGSDSNVDGGGDLAVSNDMNSTNKD